MADALIIIDMQRYSFAATPRFDAGHLCERLNALSAWVRGRGGQVIWIQHEDDGDYARGSEGWMMLAELQQDAADLYSTKTACDSFLDTGLEAMLRRLSPDRLILAGCATDFCVDTTVRSACARGFDVWVPEDGHTTADRPHLKAPDIIAHHNYVWADFIAPSGPVKIKKVADFLAES